MQFIDQQLAKICGVLSESVQKTIDSAPIQRPKWLPVVECYEGLALHHDTVCREDDTNKGVGVATELGLKLAAKRMFRRQS